MLAFFKSLFRLETVEHRRWEMLIFRVVLVFFILRMHPGLLSEIQSFPWVKVSSHVPKYDSLPHPSGIGVLLPGIVKLSDPGFFYVAKTAFFIACGLFIVGIGAPLALLYISLFDACMGGLAASQGAHGHSNQTMGLLFLGLTIGAVAGNFIAGKGGWRNLLFWSLPAQNLAFNCARQMVAAAYMVSGVTKELNSPGLWWLNSESFVLSAMKAQEEAITKRVTITQSAQDLAEWMLGHPAVAVLMLFSGWLLEICAPLLLLNRRMALLIGVLYVIFHELNGWFMGLGFPLNQYIMVVLFINLPWWIYRLGQRFTGKTPGELQPTLN